MESQTCNTEYTLYRKKHNWCGQSTSLQLKFKHPGGLKRGAAEAKDKEAAANSPQITKDTRLELMEYGLLTCSINTSKPLHPTYGIGLSYSINYITPWVGESKDASDGSDLLISISYYEVQVILMFSLLYHLMLLDRGFEDSVVSSKHGHLLLFSSGLR